MGTMRRVSSPMRAAMDQFIKDADKEVAKVGYFPSAKYPDGTPIAYIAAIMENGAPSRSIPARPTMVPTMDAHRSEWKQLMGKGVTSVVKGNRTIHDVLEAMGLLAAGEVRKSISVLLDPPLSKITILARKVKKEGGTIGGGAHIGQLAAQLKANPDMDLSGVSTKPLIDSGALQAHLTNVTEAP